MDEQVLAAMARWPDVPAVRGWLSLSARGQWRLHPRGRGWGVPDEEPGEAITSPQILAFIGRNYLSDDAGRWFFQNGPQRVYVRLDGAPWILGMDADAQGRPQLRTHTGRDYGPVAHWWLDSGGRLYARSAQGAGLVSDRDLARVVEALRTAEGRPLDDWLERPDPAGIAVRLTGDAGTDRAGAATPLGLLADGALEATLGFVRRP
ncbi:DUF2946 family protein [Castellaniella defragrans]|uniref:ABC-type multidrug transport system, ATPase and permease components n=2 Tax=Castellaniella defragrans TaxID=75697 RepID=W8X0A6_CASD6|nr:DUF2946 family protein [Castellaniella defragrans]KAB0601398.1 DUF2946 family protein [Castellaniella defragrans]MBB6083162.1 hypothetical protein [Castellaniella defragrans]CDM25309.1 ABC-type multidrug transport system, ATPase and permease components [Castellaniella defragrans 65Phen]